MNCMGDADTIHNCKLQHKVCIQGDRRSDGFMAILRHVTETPEEDIDARVVVVIHNIDWLLHDKKE